MKYLISSVYSIITVLLLVSSHCKIKKLKAWESYAQQLTDLGLVAGCIVGKFENFSHCSPGFNISSSEVASIKECRLIFIYLDFQNPRGNFSNGITVNGEKYFVLRPDENAIQGRKGSNGINVYSANSLFVLGVNNQNIPFPQAANNVKNLADYLAQNGY
jgi:hypothetical protein